jgi:prepilin-type N-terminal cleavage/methylation domain-containing protein
MKTVNRHKAGFTLVEMLVVIGIIAVLSGAGIGAYKGAIASAQKAKATELVMNVKTALIAVMQKDEAWPRAVAAEGSSGNGEMTDRVGAALARKGVLSLTYKTTTDKSTGEKQYRLTGLDQCGIVSPWASDVIKSKAASGAVSDSEKVPTGGTIRDHRLRFSIDDDFDGIVKVNYENSRSVEIRDSAAVWCCGRDGKFGTKDDVKSWSKGQER